MSDRQAEDEAMRALLSEAFRVAKEHEPKLTRPINGVIWKEGDRFHERTFQIVRRIGEDRAIILGHPDGHEGDPVEREVPWADIVDAGNLIRVAEILTLT